MFSMGLKADHLFYTPAAPAWKRLGIRHHHGINVPLFALRSQQSGGIGEFYDLLPLIEWCAEIGFDVIQLLPLNDTGDSSSPYSALSAMALNPLHLSLSQLPYLEYLPHHSLRLRELQALNHTQRIDYPTLFQARKRFLKDYFFAVEERVTTAYDYLLFMSQSPWLDIYALFKAIKAEREWQSWQAWPSEIKNAGPKEYFSLLHHFREEVNFQRCLQYLCFQQLQGVKKFAEEKGIFLKGDIPILIDRESADVWHHRRFFLLDYSAGAPPDQYSQEGQNWGFPLYNWETLASDHYNWWKLRLHICSSFYHLYRIDHAVGFFRIWRMREGESAKEGEFFPSDPFSSMSQGKRIFQALLAATSMLPIAEDLGHVPAQVRESLRTLGICTTKVMRWEREWEKGGTFISPLSYWPESMTTLSTHDSEPLALWWKNHPQEAQAYAEAEGWPTPEADLSPGQREALLWESHHSASLFHINLLNEYLPLIPGMGWDTPEEERINIPNLVSPFNWSYRFRPSVEEIASHSGLKAVMQRLLSNEKPRVNGSSKYQ